MASTARAAGPGVAQFTGSIPFPSTKLLSLQLRVVTSTYRRDETYDGRVGSRHPLQWTRL